MGWRENRERARAKSVIDGDQDLMTAVVVVLQSQRGLKQLLGVNEASGGNNNRR